MKRIKEYTIDKLKDNISYYKSIPEKLHFLDISEKEILEQIEQIFSEKPEINQIGSFVEYQDIGSSDLAPGVYEFKTKSGVSQYYSFDGGLVKSMNYSPILGEKQQNIFLNKYGNDIKKIENLYKIQKYIAAQRIFYKEQYIKYPQLNNSSIQDISREIKESPKSNNNMNMSELIQWQGTDGQIIYLFELLFNQGYITKNVYESRYAFISKHFLNKKNEPFKNTQLAQAQKNLEYTHSKKPKDSENIKRVVDSLGIVKP